MTVPFITAAALVGTRHSFCGRRGGVSTGIFASLNTGLGSSDNPAAVAENRRRAVAAVAPGTTLVTIHQVHGSTVVIADPSLAGTDRPHADGIVTDRRDVVLGILAADCAPVLFADVAAGIVGAAHAGWKGALYGVLPATIAAMEALGARRDRIAATIGPCIGQASYEVTDAYLTPFVAVDPAFARFFAPGRPGRWQFDLEGFVAAHLAIEGLAHIEALGVDTYATPHDHFSYRRTTHADEPDYGRNLSLIALGGYNKAMPARMTPETFHEEIDFEPPAGSKAW